MTKDEQLHEDFEFRVIKEKIQESIEDTEKSKSRRREDYARYILGGVLVLAFFLLPIILFGMTQHYNQRLVDQASAHKVSDKSNSVVAEPISPNEILTSTFSYASAPLAFMLGYYFNKSRDE